MNKFNVLYIYASVLLLIVFQNIVTGQERQSLSLNEGWILKSMEENEKLPSSFPKDFKNPGAEWYFGSVPKQVQEFILERKELPDPGYGDNAALWVKVFEKDWLYCNQFKTPANSENVELCLLGLDTEVDIILNGKKIVYANNMHRRWRIPVSGYLNKNGKINTLLLRFYPPRRIIGSIIAKEGKPDFPEYKYLRKTESDFGSYLGARPDFLKMGIFDDVYLDILPMSYFGEVYCRSELSENFSHAEVVVSPDIRGGKDAVVKYELLSPNGQTISKSTINNTGSFRITVNNPELWWPFTYGSQPLYKLKLSLLKENIIVDSKDILLGIRDIKMELKDEKSGDARFGFRINGKLIFMNGACWAPLDGFTHVWNEGRANKLLDMMKRGNLNCLRVWGEGNIPDESFFEKCDRDGIILWMEFMTASGLRFPLDKPWYLSNIRAEIEDEVKRLRNYTSIAIWCGGNEHYLGYTSNSNDLTIPLGRELFQKIMPEIVGKYDPQRYFHPSSPWGGENWPTGNYPLEGDWHDYWTYRFLPKATVPLFSSEVCQVSPYSLHNMKRFIPEEELWPKGIDFSIDKPGKVAWPDGWQKHTAASGWEKTGNIQDYCDIKSAADACRVFGTAHGEYLRNRYEEQRRGTPDGNPDGKRRSWGALIWRLNDTWPIIYMSVVDYFLEPKIPYYFLKRACEPVLVTFEQTPEEICTWVVNDSAKPLNDSLFVELWTFDGKMKKRIARKVNLPSGESNRIVDLTNEFHEIWKREEFLVARLGNQVVSHLLWPERGLKLKDGDISATVSGDEIVLSSQVFIKDVELYLKETSGAIFSDNFFNLIPGESKRIKIIDRQGGKSLEIKGVNSNLKVLAL
jgi:beta-mannosidase